MTERELSWRRALVPRTATLTETIENLNAVGIRLVLCVHDDGRLYGSVTDGDVRRGLLRGLSMDRPVSEIANPNPLVVPEGTDREIVRSLMVANRVQQVPVVDTDGRPVGLHLWDTLDRRPERDNVMVIMAGGKGRRLRPHTDYCPKPMLDVAGKPLLEHIVERARSQGISHFVISVHYLGEVIRDHFGDGAAHGVRIDYVTEDAPLGTAGALALLSPRPDLPFLVTNGDVLTDIDYGEVLEFRARHDAAAVMAVRAYELANPFGVVKTDGVDIAGFVEKPVIRSHINAGIYAFRPDALDHLERDRYCDMPLLFDRLRGAGRRTVAFPMHEPWLDVGRPNDLSLADQQLASGAET